MQHRVLSAIVTGVIAFFIVGSFTGCIMQLAVVQSDALGMVGLGCSAIIAFMIARRNYLKSWPGHPIGHCPKCGYDLTGNASGTCPECGTRLRRDG